jgi:hypothetical protein
MRREEFDSLCRAIRSGEEKFVENLDTHYTGKIISCAARRLEVEIAGRRESWPMEACEETMGSRFGHKEKTLDTHPWDIDRFNPYG